jgi:hypothetical protein
MTVQDLGRCAHLGISASGAADALSLRAGNLLVGNPESAAALEMTLAGRSNPASCNAAPGAWWRGEASVWAHFPICPISSATGLLFRY